MMTFSVRRGAVGRGLGVVVVVAPPPTAMLTSLTDCFLPVLLNVPVTLHPLIVSKETWAPFVHLDFLGVHFGKTLETWLQSSSKVTLMVQRKFTFPHFTGTALTVSSRARVVVVVIKTRKVTLKSVIAFKIVELSLAPSYKSADRVTGGQVKCASPQIGKALSMHERMNQREAVDEKNYFGITSQIGWKGFKILK